MHQAPLNIVYILTYLLLTTTQGDTVNSLILQVRKLRRREVKRLIPDDRTETPGLGVWWQSPLNFLSTALTQGIP